MALSQTRLEREATLDGNDLIRLEMKRLGPMAVEKGDLLLLSGDNNADASMWDPNSNGPKSYQSQVAGLRLAAGGVFHVLTLKSAGEATLSIHFVFPSRTDPGRQVQMWVRRVGRSFQGAGSGYVLMNMRHVVNVQGKTIHTQTGNTVCLDDITDDCYLDREGRFVFVKSPVGSPPSMIAVGYTNSDGTQDLAELILTESACPEMLHVFSTLEFPD